ncbi:asparagine synthase (glutamine-hydrolyzing) [Candidatus Omnitrophota bacterium]
MCGIFGGLTRQDASVMERMGRMLAHRGPDDCGCYKEEGLYLGHRRLSIIDLDTGHQPMISSDRRHIIVYNGEIYNFNDIKKELQLLGHIFSTTSDTEVILYAYRQWGRECLHRFNGMFSFALWDSDAHQLWLVRDRMGQKPLYYMKTKESFYFSSEAKALWILPDFKPQYDATAIDQYLTFRYVPGVRTFFEDIRKVPAGHWMLVERDGSFKMHQWWKKPDVRDVEEVKSLDQYREEFESLFSSAVKLRLVSDVPVGLFLSSGIDSSSIALETAKSSRLKCFSLGFGEKTDELGGTKRFAEQLNVPYVPYVLTKKDFSYFEEAVSSFDEPYGDPIILPTYILTRLAQQHVKVVLTGDGADEILANYVHHDYFRKVFGRMSPMMGKMIGAAVKLVPSQILSSFMNYPASLGKRGKNRLGSLLGDGNDLLSSYMRFVSIFTAEDKKDLYSKGFADSVFSSSDHFGSELSAAMGQTREQPLDRVARWDAKTWFPEQTLMKLDRLGMANSLEGRCPYADYRLTEFFSRMPFTAFEQLSRGKNVVRNIYQQQVHFIAKKKQAFYMPMDNHFSTPLHSLVEEMFQGGDLQDCGWFEKKQVENLLKERHHSPLLMDKQIMSLVILMMWRRGVEKIIKNRLLN